MTSFCLYLHRIGGVSSFYSHYRLPRHRFNVSNSKWFLFSLDIESKIVTWDIKKDFDFLCPRSLNLNGISLRFLIGRKMAYTLHPPFTYTKTVGEVVRGSNCPSLVV